MNLTLHHTSLDELDEIRDVLVDSFGTKEGPALVRLLQQLAQDNALTLALLARVEEEAVGFVAFSPVTLETQPLHAQIEGLAPLGVRQKWQKKGIGSALIKEGLNFLQNKGTQAVVVLGEAAYYKRFGFENALSLGITNEYGAKEHFRIHALADNGLAGLSGLARYAPAFQGI
jgi:putative acetyltransferase